MKISYIRLLLEYSCYPVWLYDEDGCVIDTILPPEWQDDTELDNMFSQVQDAYDALFIDNEREFSDTDFQSDAEREKFILSMNAAVDALNRKNAGKYRIINDLRI